MESSVHLFTSCLQTGRYQAITRIGVFARGQIQDISPKGLQVGHFDVPGIMSEVKMDSSAVSSKRHPGQIASYFRSHFSQNGRRWPFCENRF